MKVKVDCALSDALMRLDRKPEDALDLLSPYYTINETNREVSVSGSTDDERVNVYLHLGKIFR